VFLGSEFDKDPSGIVWLAHLLAYTLRQSLGSLFGLKKTLN